MTAEDELVDPAPGPGPLSTDTTARPLRASSRATDAPITPAPMTIASNRDRDCASLDPITSVTASPSILHPAPVAAESTSVPGRRGDPLLTEGRLAHLHVRRLRKLVSDVEVAGHGVVREVLLGVVGDRLEVGARVHHECNHHVVLREGGRYAV